MDLHSLVSKYKRFENDLQDKQYTIKRLKEQLNSCKEEVQRQERRNEDYDKKNRQLVTEMKTKQERLQVELRSKKN